MDTKLVTNSSMAIAYPCRLRERRNPIANGNRKIAATVGGSVDRGLSLATLVDEAGTWNDSDTSLSVANAGSDHEVLVCCVHPDVLRVAVAPGGKPVTVSSVTVGNVVPVVGVIVKVYVAVPPGETVCDGPLPLPVPPPPDTGLTPKLRTSSESVLVDVPKFVSPL